MRPKRWTGRQREIWLAVVVVLLALALRLLRLDYQSYWYDESVSLLTARLPLLEIAPHHIADSARHTYPPFYSYVLHLWGLLFGSSALAGRMLSAVAGTSAVALLFVLVRRLVGSPAGLLAAALLAVSQVGVAYSQETRAYALMMALSLGAACCLDAALMRRRLSGWVGFCVASSALALTHYHSLWMLVALWSFALAAPLVGLRALPARWWIGGLGLCLLFVLPWFAGGGLNGLLQAQAEQPTEMPSYFQASWDVFAQVLGSYNNARWTNLLSPPTPGPQLAGFVLYTVPLLLAGVPALVAVARRETLEPGDRAAILLGSTAALAMFGPVAIALMLRGVPYDIRYTSLGIGFYCGLVGVGAMRLRPRALRSVAVVAMLAFGLTALRVNYEEPTKENWRDSLGWFAEDGAADDVAIFVPSGEVPETWSVYHPDRSPPVQRSLEAAIAEPPSGRVWLFSYGRLAQFVRQGREAAITLERGGYRVVAQRRYHWIAVSVWQR